jgi:hypothetical protein
VKRKITVLAGLTVFVAVTRADRGGIPFLPDVTVYEPGQKAIVAWEKGREALILSTDIHASRETDVLEIMPFPSEPAVAEAHHVAFVCVEYLVNRAIKKALAPTRQMIRGGQCDTRDGIEVISHQAIGAHDLSVIKVRNPNEVLDWITSLLAKRAPQARVPEALPNLLAAYYRDGYQYFAFDVIRVTPTTQSVEPLLYTFRSPCLYYPMRISSLYSRDTTITLTTMTRGPIAEERMHSGFQRMTFAVNDDRPFTALDEKRHFIIPIVSLRQKHLRRLSTEMAAVFPRGEAVLQMWRYKGTLNIRTDVAVQLAGEWKEGG